MYLYIFSRFLFSDLSPSSSSSFAVVVVLLRSSSSTTYDYLASSFCYLFDFLSLRFRCFLFLVAFLNNNLSNHQKRIKHIYINYEKSKSIAGYNGRVIDKCVSLLSYAS